MYVIKEKEAVNTTFRYDFERVIAVIRLAKKRKGTEEG